MKFKEVVTSIIDFLTASIFEEIEEENENKALLIEFEQAKRIIAERNKQKIIEEKLIPYAITSTLERENYLISEQQARFLAEGYFAESKANGNIDELNRLVEKEVI